ncbi:DMT family transporter [Bdellovibrio sp. HCB209]|uniref:DMT family transporter n=1 Tax=Bdellovibrio sp. HCB209 TaxID=3394354 RepID=UPI0039B3FB96
MTTKNRAAIELIIAGALWGFGFVATVWALRGFTPTETLVYRFLIASVFGELLYLLMRGPRLTTAKDDFKRALPAGFFLGTMLLLQTIGLQDTTATKSGFITSLYVILVPLLNTVLFKSRSSWINYALALVALVGTFILMDANLSDVNSGDLWTLACSVMAAGHIIYIGKISNKVGNAFRFNNFQSIWVLLMITPLLLTQNHFTYQNVPWEAWWGVLALGMGSSVIAFSIQIRAQKTLSDSTASMIFLLESPFAALFGFLLLQERLSWFQGIGALIIMAASILQILWDPSSKTTGTQSPK